MIKAVIFDCFGVLVNDGLQALCDEVLVDRPAAIEQVRATIQRANKGLTTPDEYNREIEKVFGFSHDEYRQRIRNAETKNDELLSYILQLKLNYKTGLLTNISNLDSLHRRFSDAELSRYFDATVLSGVEGYAKPEAQIYEIAADRLGVRLDECVFIDDRAEYCDGATAVGMHAIQFESFEQFKIDLTSLLDQT